MIHYLHTKSTDATSLVSLITQIRARGIRALCSHGLELKDLDNAGFFFHSFS